jgi:L-asparaginase II
MKCSMLDGEPLVEVCRGGSVESVHRIAACACDADGTVRLAVGTIDVPVFVRSTVKPIIAVTVISAALQAGLPLKSEEIAVIAASHFGEPAQVALVERLLARSGSRESDLQCGAAHRRHGGTAATTSPIYNNCSGKHAGLLLLCTLLGVNPANYLDPLHPVNRAWMATAGRIYGVDVATLPQGIDGCGLPVFAVPLRTQAQAYARLITLLHLADQDQAGVAALRLAMLEHPRLVGGVGHLDTKLMLAEPRSLLAKIGAEGVHCSGSTERAMGLAVKVVDGNDRARPVAVIGLLTHLGVLSPRGLDALAEFAASALHNVAGLPVGEIRFAREGLGRSL